MHAGTFSQRGRPSRGVRPRRKHSPAHLCKLRDDKYGPTWIDFSLTYLERSAVGSVTKMWMWGARFARLYLQSLGRDDPLPEAWCAHRRGTVALRLPPQLHRASLLSFLSLFPLHKCISSSAVTSSRRVAETRAHRPVRAAAPRGRGRGPAGRSVKSHASGCEAWGTPSRSSRGQKGHPTWSCGSPPTSLPRGCGVRAQS